jgi:hypothetical protein
MGVRGPIGKRSEERMGHRAKDEADSITKAPSGAPADLDDVPQASGRWHPTARRWYESLPKSGQSQFYEPSDWAMAHYAAELMSRLLREDRLNGQAIAALDGLMARLLSTEGDRRRARIELTRKPAAGETSSSVTVLDDYRAAFGG